MSPRRRVVRQNVAVCEFFTSCTVTFNVEKCKRHVENRRRLVFAPATGGSTLRGHSWIPGRRFGFDTEAYRATNYSRASAGTCACPTRDVTFRRSRGNFRESH